MHAEVPRRAQAVQGLSEKRFNSQISPDGQWLAYQSDESGQDEIYVRPFLDVTASRQQVSTNGGTRPLWSRDGNELFYFMVPNTIMAVSVQPGTELALGEPAVAVQGSYAVPFVNGLHYDVSRDGRFLLLKDAAETSDERPPQITVVLNWHEELKARVPVD